MDHEYSRVVSKKVFNSNRICSVPLCLNRTSSTVSLHAFPTNNHYRKLWALACGMGDYVTKSAQACSDHFKKEDFIPSSKIPVKKRRLKRNAVPSLKLTLIPLSEMLLSQEMELLVKEQLKDIKGIIKPLPSKKKLGQDPMMLKHSRVKIELDELSPQTHSKKRVTKKDQLKIEQVDRDDENDAATSLLALNQGIVSSENC